MSEHWNSTSNWQPPRRHDEPKPIPIPTNSGSKHIASPRSESYGGGSLPRQVVENILHGSPCTPKQPEFFHAVENPFMHKNVCIPQPQPYPPQAGNLLPGTPEVPMFLNTFTPMGHTTWNGLPTMGPRPMGGQPQQAPVSPPHQQLSPAHGMPFSALSPTPSNDYHASVFSTSPPNPSPMPNMVNGQMAMKTEAVPPPMPLPQNAIQELLMNPALVMAAQQLLAQQQQQQLLQAAAAQLLNNQNQFNSHQQQLPIQLLQQLKLNPNMLSMQQPGFPMNQQMNPFQLAAENYQNNGKRQQRQNDTFTMSTQKHSPMLEDLKNNRGTNLSLRDIGSCMCEFAMDQHGSRFIQQKLERADLEEKTLVYDAIRENSLKLMTDVFGNYVVQKFFEHGTEEQKAGVCALFKGRVQDLALQMYGCRVIQKSIETCPDPIKEEVVAELKGQVIRFITDQNGNHVMQKIIEKLPPPRLQFILDAIAERDNGVIELSTNSYGCRVIQRLLEHCNKAQKEPIKRHLYKNIDRLLTDQYGNYVIQHLVERGDSYDWDLITAAIKDKVFPLSQNKFSSNVIERILQFASQYHKNLLIAEVCEPSDQGQPLMQMMKDQYANYVVQKMLDEADSTHRKKMLIAIKPHIQQLKKVNYGKHIMAKIEKKLGAQMEQPMRYHQAI